jgi:hypothetical protein
MRTVDTEPEPDVSPYLRPETRPEKKIPEAKIFQRMQDLPFLSGFDDVSTGDWENLLEKSIIKCFSN